MFTVNFWKETIEKMVRTAAQFLITTQALDTLGTDLSASWKTHLTGAAMAAGVSMLMNLAGSKVGSNPETGSVLTQQP